VPVSDRAVILAGGRGTRLGPFTHVLPKPLLPIGEEAILEVVVDQLREHGFTRLTLAVGYLAHLIEAVFGDGSERGVRIDYHREREPLGTVGALPDIDGLDETFLIMNGDVLTDLDYRRLYDAHRAGENVLTIATQRRVDRSDYGVLHLDGRNGATHRVTGYDEKPATTRVVSTGVYIAEPSVLARIPAGQPLDLPDLVLALIAAGEPVGSYHHEGLWLDIGRHEDYERAIVEYASSTSPIASELESRIATRPRRHEDLAGEVRRHLT
jgi:NDP-mannose synthase